MANLANDTAPSDDDLLTGVLPVDAQTSVPAYVDEDATAPPARKSRGRNILQFEIVRRRVSRKDLMHFSRQLSVFLRSGIPVVEALEIMIEGVADKTLKAAAIDIIKTLRAGDTVATAARAHPEVFPPVYVGILRSAELTGSLDVVLDQLADYLERDLVARKRITSALFYPTAVFALSIVTVGIVGFFVLPRFADFFRSFDADLPLSTRMVLALADFSQDWGAVVAGAIAVGVVGLVLFCRTAIGRRWRDIVVLRLPVVGDLVQHAIVERFCRVLSSMVDAGVSLPEALKVTTDATANTVFQTRLNVARDQVLRGDGLAGPLTATGLFPVAAQQMFRVGENTGTLTEQLRRAADYFEGELGYKINRVATMFEPAVIIFMGGMVGFVALALVSAMYGIFNQV